MNWRDVSSPPRVAVIDDLFGREISAQRNADRDNLCATLLLRDQTTPLSLRELGPRVSHPVADALFFRGQHPLEARPGDLVENDIEATLRFLASGWKEGVERWSLVLLDLCFYTGRVTPESHRRSAGMPEGRTGDDDPARYFGLVLLEEIRRSFPELPVLILSSKPRDEVSLEFSRRGALGFIARDDPRGAEFLEQAIHQHGLVSDPAGEVVGRALPLLLALREARRAAQHRESLLILGERGTGKELLAHFVHRTTTVSSEGRALPLLTVNSAGFSPSMFAAELFGVEPKVASGVDAKVGLIERTSGGDLFFDEIGDMPAEVQAGILRVLQDRQVTRVGGHQPRDVDVRFLSATNVDLEDPARGFRSDLLDRLREGGTLALPPLRARKEDIPILLGRFVREAESRRPGALRREISPEALDLLMSHDWPGNVRELRSVAFEVIKRFPDVEHLVPGHIRLLSSRVQGVALAETARPDRRRQAVDTDAAGPSLDELLRSLSRVEFAASAPSEWAGRLGELERAHHRLNARLVLCALEATRRRTPRDPEGTLKIHPALKLLTGDSDLTASQAADALKRLLGPIEHELEGDLREAFEIALRLRPKSVGSARRRHSVAKA